MTHFPYILYENKSLVSFSLSSLVQLKVNR